MKEGLLIPSLKVHNPHCENKSLQGKEHVKLIKNKLPNDANSPHMDSTHKFTNHPQRCDQSQPKIPKMAINKTYTTIKGGKRCTQPNSDYMRYPPPNK